MMRSDLGENDTESSSVRKGFSKKFLTILATALVLLSLVALKACKGTPQKESINLVLIDQGWLNQTVQNWHTSTIQDFFHDSGTRLDLYPAPEAAADQLNLWKSLLESHSTTPDIYGIDIIWPQILGKHLADLGASIGEEEKKQYFPSLLANDIVDGKLVALPNRLDSGLLFYRTDLLQKYGYTRPPDTWEELEKMALRIQQGERAGGNKNFWGYVWQGATSEALTCNALEWQASEGGGKIIEDNKVVSINNPNTIRAWERAARWVGTISPSGVVAYKEWDAMNFWLAGKVAFMRNWTPAYITSRDSESIVHDNFGVTILPRGQAGHTAAIGGVSYGVSQYSQHMDRAIAFSRYITKPSTLAAQAKMLGTPPAVMSLYKDPEMLKAFPYWKLYTPEYVSSLTFRPAGVAGGKYSEISRAYFETVHDVLIKKKSAAEAAAELETELIQRTGYPKGDPAPVKLVQ